jgi:hypothetical protein
MNEFMPPPDESCGRAFPSRDRAFQFTLRSMFALITATLVGGATTHHEATHPRTDSDGFFVGGKRVELSMFGETLFFAFGCVGGAACAVGAGFSWPHVWKRYSIPELPTIWRRWLFIPAAMLTGLLGGKLSTFLSGFVLLFFPNSAVMQLLNVPP